MGLCSSPRGGLPDAGGASRWETVGAGNDCEVPASHEREAMSREAKGERKTLGTVLALVFLFAMFMGPGPGVYLVNPDPTDPNTRLLFFGMPVIYVWAVCWFFVQAAVVLLAYVLLWRGDGPTQNESKVL